jgi:uncharacterized protein YciI
MYFLHLSLTEKFGSVEPYRDAHVEWVKKYVDRGVFLLASAKVNGLGGMIMSKGVDKKELRSIISEDPYYANDLVEYQIIDVDVRMVQPELKFLEKV